MKDTKLKDNIKKKVSKSKEDSKISTSKKPKEVKDGVFKKYKSIDISGKSRVIYTKNGSKKQYIKYKNNFVPLVEYKQIQKSAKVNTKRKSASAKSIKGGVPGGHGPGDLWEKNQKYFSKEEQDKRMMEMEEYWKEIYRIERIEKKRREREEREREEREREEREKREIAAAKKAEEERQKMIEADSSTQTARPKLKPFPRVLQDMIIQQNKDLILTKS